MIKKLVVILSLKKSVVIVNEYTVKGSNGKGSRGSTPGKYTTRYMARSNATEVLGPVRNMELDDFIKHYMARKSAVDKKISSDVYSMYKSLDKVSGNGGVAFGRGDISLSNEKLNEKSKHIQDMFDQGKTVLKTVISFDEEYLRKHKVIDKDFKCNKKGDYRGNIDQLKLRRAIMHGIDNMSRHFDDLDYIGVIQVDTKHVHCHLAMVDNGKGFCMTDGTQRGKILSKMKRDFRYGLDNELDDQKHIKIFSSSFQNEKRNVKGFVKRYAYEMVKQNSFCQLLYSVLPENKNLWRASSNNKEMKKANIIVGEFVDQLFEKDNSGYKDAYNKVKEYADYRHKNETLDEREYQYLLENGEKKIRDSAINSVYSVMKSLKNTEIVNINNDFKDILNMDFDTLVAKREKENDDIYEFGFKLRNYSNRLNKHRQEKKKYKELSKNFDKEKELGNVSQDANVLGDFYKFEMDYQDKCMVKYQHFLKFLPISDTYMNDFNNLIVYRKKMENLNNMMKDPDVKRMTPFNAEIYCRNLYDQHGGQYVSGRIEILEDRYNKMCIKEQEMTENLKDKLNDYGLDLDEKGIKRQLRFDFDEVKDLDLHHVLFDFKNGTNVSKLSIDNFLQVAHERQEKLNKVVNYIKNTFQDESYLESLPINDVENMNKLANRFINRPIIDKPAVEIEDEKILEENKNAKSIRLDINLDYSIRDNIKQVINNIEYEL